jgi:ubiquinone/menaquinone biosynthesis C-methylase UbiE
VYASATEYAYGVEQSAAMLHLAKARLAEFGVDGWRLVRGDAFHLPIGEDTFDFVMCFKLIRHFTRDDRLALLAETRGVLQPGGHLLLDIVNEPANSWLYDKWGVQGRRIDDYWWAYLWRLSPLAAQVVSRALEIITLRAPLEWMALCACE